MAEGAGSREQFVPARYQPPLPIDRLILRDGSAGAGDRMELDVLVVGAGPAGLACAIELAQLARRNGTELNIGVLEKAERSEEHTLNSSHSQISYAVFCLKKKKKIMHMHIKDT